MSARSAYIHSIVLLCLLPLSLLLLLNVVGEVRQVLPDLLEVVVLPQHDAGLVRRDVTADARRVARGARVQQQYELLEVDLFVVVADLPEVVL
jgi:hypothetical protein